MKLDIHAEAKHVCVCEAEDQSTAASASVSWRCGGGGRPVDIPHTPRSSPTPTRQGGRRTYEQEKLDLFAVFRELNGICAFNLRRTKRGGEGKRSGSGRGLLAHIMMMHHLGACCEGVLLLFCQLRGARTHDQFTPIWLRTTMHQSAIPLFHFDEAISIT